MNNLLAAGNGIYLKMGALIGATAALGLFATTRFSHAGDWLPDFPAHIGAWEATDTPLPDETLRTLGNPRAICREYANPFGEAVRASVITAGAFENFHDPTVCVTGGGFNLTARRNMPIDGPGTPEMRAMVFKHSDPVNGDVRMMMYYWQQRKNGSTSTDAVMGNYRDMAARFKTGFGAVAQGHQTVLVRIYAPVDPEDKNGAQTQRNLDEIARTMYRALKKDGAESQ